MIHDQQAHSSHSFRFYAPQRRQSQEFLSPQPETSSSTAQNKTCSHLWCERCTITHRDMKSGSSRGAFVHTLTMKEDIWRLSDRIEKNTLRKRQHSSTQRPCLLGSQHDSAHLHLLPPTPGCFVSQVNRPPKATKKGSLPASPFFSETLCWSLRRNQ